MTSPESGGPSKEELEDMLKKGKLMTSERDAQANSERQLAEAQSREKAAEEDWPYDGNRDPDKWLQDMDGGSGKYIKKD